jgi:hypothetical protein
LKKRSKKLLLPVGCGGANAQGSASKKFFAALFYKKARTFFLTILIAHPRPLALRRIDAH